MVIVSPFVYQELTTTNMEEYVDYLKRKIQECELEDMHVSVSVYKEVLLYLCRQAESIVT
jgi:hypothetical protein